MTPETNQYANTAEKTRPANAAWDETPAGRKKDAALKHYDEIVRELDAVANALS
jgi:hypothetical protein